MLYSSSLDPYIGEISLKSDRVILIEEHHKGYFVKDISLNPEIKQNQLFIPFLPEDQKTLEEFLWEGT